MLVCVNSSYVEQQNLPLMHFPTDAFLTVYHHPKAVRKCKTEVPLKKDR